MGWGASEQNVEWTGWLGHWIPRRYYLSTCGAKIINMFPISIDPRSDHWPAQWYVRAKNITLKLKCSLTFIWILQKIMCPENSVGNVLHALKEGRLDGGGGVFNNLTQPRLNRVTPPLLITSPLTSCHLAFVIIPQLLSLRKNTIKAGGSTAICKMWTGLEWSGYPLDCYDY